MKTISPEAIKQRKNNLFPPVHVILSSTEDQSFSDREQNRLRRYELMKKMAALMMVFMLLFVSAAYAEGTIPGLEDGVLTVAMECAYAPYNWAQPDNANDAVPIKDSLLYANGYDVMTAKAICEANGWQLEIMQLD